MNRSIESDIPKKKPLDLELKWSLEERAWFIIRKVEGAPAFFQSGPFKVLPEVIKNKEQLSLIYRDLHIQKEEEGEFNQWLLYVRINIKTTQGEEPDSEETARDWIENEREKILQYFDDTYLFYCDRFDPDLTLYVWIGNMWQPIAEAIVLEELSRLPVTERPKISKDGVIDFFKGKGQNTKVVPKPPHLIAFLNGLYDAKNDVLLPHDPGFFCVNVIPHDFNPDAKCPNWEKFLADVHYAEDLNFIQEWWGYQLYTSYGAKGFVFFIGSGDNGKTRELLAIENVLGHKNITNITLQNLNHGHYHCAELFHKLSNISDDISTGKVWLSGNLKIASDGGWLNAMEKYGKPFDFQNYAKITESCNEPPEIADSSDAIWTRMKAIDFPFTFKNIPDINKGEKQARPKEDIDAELEAEAEGILNWMIKGLQRLLSNNFKFSYSVSSESVKEFYQVKSNPILFFVEKCMEYTANEDDDVIRKKDLYPTFKKWCKDQGLKVVPSSTKFFRDLKDAGLEAVQSREFDRERVYRGYVCHSVTTYKTALVRKQQLKLEDIEKKGEEVGSESCDAVPPSVPKKPEPVPIDFVAIDPKRIVGLNVLPFENVGECANCLLKPESLSHYVETTDGKTVLVCRRCADQLEKERKR